MTSCKALVVEPDEKTRETIDDILTTLDCTYEIADSLAQARKMLARSDHDLVLPAYDMPSRTGSKPRPQNAEHFMLSLRKARSKNMPKVIMLINEQPSVSDEDIARWAFDMRDLGVSDVVRKPLADAGRTLDRVIKKVMGLGDSGGSSSCLAAGSPHPSGKQLDTVVSGTAALVGGQDKIGIALTKPQIDILAALAADPNRTLFQVDIIAAAGYSKHATSQHIARLRKLGLIDQPQGSRAGFALTAEGRARLNESR